MYNADIAFERLWHFSNKMTNIINRFKNSGKVHQGTHWFWFKTNKNSLFFFNGFSIV